MNEQKEYKVFTEQGNFNILAYDDSDAMRIALWLCWRDGNDFLKIESASFSNRYTLGIYMVDKHNYLTTLLTLSLWTTKFLQTNNSRR